MATKVEATNNELVIRDPEGNVVVVKPEDSAKVQHFIDIKDYDSVNKTIKPYPSSNDYAKGGELYVGNPPEDDPNIKLKDEDESASLFKNIENIKKQLSEAAINKDSPKALHYGRQLTTANKLQSSLKTNANILSNQEDILKKLDTEEYGYMNLNTPTKEIKEKREGLYEAYGDLGKEAALDNILNVKPNRLTYDRRINAPYIDNRKDLQTRMTELKSQLSNKGEEFLKTRDNTLAAELNTMKDELADTQQSLDLFSPESTGIDFTLDKFQFQNQKAFGGTINEVVVDEATSNNQFTEGGVIKAEEGLTVKKDPPEEKGLLETAGNYISESVESAGNYLSEGYDNLFGSDTKKGKQLTKLPKDEGSIRMDVSNYPEYGLTSSESIDKFYNSKVSDQPGLPEYPIANIEGTEDFPGKYKCTGSSCRAVRHRFPELKNARDLLLEKGNTAFTGDSRDISDSGFDAWEIHQALRQEGLGTDIFSSDTYEDESEIPEGVDYTKQRTEAKANFDPSKLAIGAMIGMGNAEGVYINKGDEASYRYEGKKKSIDPNQQKSRHSATVIGFDEESGDAFVYDYGTKIRVGKSTSTGADYTWDEWLDMRNVNYITNINENSQWTYSGLQQGKKQIATQKEIKSKTK